MVEIEAIDYLIILALAMPTLWVLGSYIGRFIGGVLCFVTYSIYTMVAGEPVSVRYNGEEQQVRIKGLLAARLVLLKCKRDDFGFKAKTKKEQE